MAKKEEINKSGDVMILSETKKIVKSPETIGKYQYMYQLNKDTKTNWERFSRKLNIKKTLCRGYKIKHWTGTVI